MIVPNEENLWKRPWEEIWFYHQFKRFPTPGWLKTGESIASIDGVKAYDPNGNDVSSAMIVSSQIVENTKVGYFVKGGTAGTTYEIRIQITSSGGEKFEDHVDLEVVST